eukprot:NODE_260_length_12610_cov_0.413076.p1 type:complete len:453 gc:universal NODE_260_length_12610_cov_0.413076:5079-3721(-)
MKLEPNTIFKRRYVLKPTPLHIRVLSTQANSLWGFVVLAWFSGAMIIFLTIYGNYKLSKSLIGSYLMNLSMSNIIEVVLFDVLLVLCSFLSFILQKLIVLQIIPTRIGAIVQRVYEISFIGLSNYYVYNQNWNWASSGALTVHSISILFKCHSYNIVNRRLFEQKKLLNQLEANAKKNDDVTISQQIADIESILTIKVPTDIEYNNNLYNTPEIDNSPTLQVSYPENITLRNFIEYLIFPTLIYDIAYPRMKSIRYWFIFEKLIEFVGSTFLLYVVIESYIIPQFQNDSNSFVDLLVTTSGPFMICILLVFNIIFEVICNVCAEITQYADRNFYSDFWNSTNYLEFSRKWNKPVHNFLFRHVYLECHFVLGLSKNSARILTFFISSLLHELLFVVVFKELKWYMFVIQMFQIPLIAVQELPQIKRFPIAGNLFFWFGIYSGVPLLCIAYNKF